MELWLSNSLEFCRIWSRGDLENFPRPATSCHPLRRTREPPRKGPANNCGYLTNFGGPFWGFTR